MLDKVWLLLPSTTFHLNDVQLIYVGCLRLTTWHHWGVVFRCHIKHEKKIGRTQLRQFAINQKKTRQVAVGLLRNLPIKERRLKTRATVKTPWSSETRTAKTNFSIFDRKMKSGAGSQSKIPPLFIGGIFDLGYLRSLKNGKMVKISIRMMRMMKTILIHFWRFSGNIVSIKIQVTTNKIQTNFKFQNPNVK